jgi:uncharacterized protein (TIGR01370 family)
MVAIEPTVTYDPDFDAKDMVNRIKASKASDGIHRKLVIAYIDIGEAEEWRWYWGNHKTYEEYGECKQSYIDAIQNWAPFVVACDPDGWGGNYPVAFWDDDWKDIAIYGTTLGSDEYFDSLLDEVVQDGFDGVYLDWVEAWEMEAVQDRADDEGKDPGTEMLNFIKEIRAYGKQYNNDFIVIQQNSSELINEVGADELKNAVDAIAQEAVWWDGIGGNDDWTDPEGYDYASCCTNYYLTRLRKYKNAGFPVFVCDYAVTHAEEVYQKTAAEGFIGYATRRSLARLTTTPPTFVVTESPEISLDKTELTFVAVIGGTTPASQTVTVHNSGEGTLNWSVSDDVAWLTCTPASGTDDETITVSADVSFLYAGTHTAEITISDANASNSPQTVDVTFSIYEAGSDDDPFGSFDTPLDGSTVRSSVAVTGWALDDVGIDSIKIYRQINGTNAGLAYIGDALRVEGARTDIESAYPGYPDNQKAGWGYMMLTNFLPNGGNGTFTLHAVVTDISGHEVTLGTKTITCDNANAVKPFGAIDTPVPGTTASGASYRNHGWVLTPMPNSIPVSGATISVLVDGVSLGHPVYNIYRSDIASLFPGYANSDGAHGYFDMDTTQFSNGVHTIAWSAVDSAGSADGIGSRYFVVRNSQRAERTAHSSVGRGNPLWLPVDYSEPVGVIKGYNPDAKSQKIHPDAHGIINIKIHPLERIQVRFAPLFSASSYSGYQLVGTQARPLPVGSFLDRQRGIFYWQPGPGFLGRFRLVFIVPLPKGESLRKEIVIEISKLK